MQKASFKVRETARYAHHRKAFRAVLSYMSALGVDAQTCLSGTGLNEEKLAGSEPELSLAQEITFYRNIVALRPSPTIGLQLGELFRFETYGLLGYALLSSATVSEAIQTTVDFAPLTFSHFKISKTEQGNLCGIAFVPKGNIPEDLVQLYSDRDLSAGLTGLRSIIPDLKSPSKISLVHADVSNRSVYENYFGCEIEFSAGSNALLIERQFADIPLPRRDREASSYCKEQCEVLLARLGQTEATIVKKVREAIIESPGAIASLDDVATRLNIGVRTLRRELSSAGTSYKSLLQDIRLELAEEYLHSKMSLDAIANRLGYSEAANFSHAFKRWRGISPKTFRNSFSQRS